MTSAMPATTPDSDGDGVADVLDNCPEVANVAVSARAIEMVLQPHPENTLLGDDARSGVLDLGFEFPFFSGWREQVRVHANGFITFQTGGRNQRHDRARSLPSEEAARLAIFGFWTDLDPSAGGVVRYGTTGEAPDRIFTVEWDRVPPTAPATRTPATSFRSCCTSEVRSRSTARPARHAAPGPPRKVSRTTHATSPSRRKGATSEPSRSTKTDCSSSPWVSRTETVTAWVTPKDEDRDGDGHLNDADVCPDVADPEQGDRDKTASATCATTRKTKTETTGPMSPTTAPGQPTQSKTRSAPTSAYRVKSAMAIGCTTAKG